MEKERITWDSAEEVKFFCELLKEPTTLAALVDPLSVRYGKSIASQAVINQFNRLVNIIGKPRKVGELTYQVDDQDTAIGLIDLYYEDRAKRKAERDAELNRPKRKYTRRKVRTVNDLESDKIEILVGDDRKILTRLSPEQRDEMRYGIFQILYFSKSGMTASEVREAYFQRYKRPLNDRLIECFFKELDSVLPVDSYKYSGNRFRVLNYIEGIRVIAPSKVHYHAIVELPAGTHLATYGDFSDGTSTLLGQYENNSKSLYEISQYNTRDQFRILVKIVMAGGKILSPQYLADKVDHTIRTWIDNLNEVIH